MATLTIDTYDFINGLKAAGMPESQAVAISEGLKKIDLEHVTTKDDLEKLELRMTIKLGGMIIALGAFLSVLKFFG